jgi:hypothetical protein
VARHDDSGRRSTLGEYVDVRLHDRVALDEIELYSEVLSAVAASDHPLSDDELDEVLGLGRTHMGAAPDRNATRPVERCH